MLNPGWPLVFLVLGALLYALPLNAKICEMGRILFSVGALWLVYALGHASLRIAQRDGASKADLLDVISTLPPGHRTQGRYRQADGRRAGPW